MKAKNTRQLIPNSKFGKMYKNVIRAHRKVVAEIWEPCHITGGKFSLSVKIAPGYSLNAKANTLDEIITKFHELTNFEYDIE